jgi:hypothetical protein
MGDRGDLGGMIDERLFEGGEKMLRPDLGKWRRLVRRLPRDEQRVRASGSRIFRGFRHREISVLLPEGL